jgi:hypothetical protein
MNMDINMDMTLSMKWPMDMDMDTNTVMHTDTLIGTAIDMSDCKIILSL